MNALKCSKQVSTGIGVHTNAQKSTLAPPPPPHLISKEQQVDVRDKLNDDEIPSNTSRLWFCPRLFSPCPRYCFFLYPFTVQLAPLFGLPFNSIVSAI